MTPRPLVSVVLPTRNREALVMRAIASVLAQTWDHLELIVVNDNSTDGTRAALATITDPRLHVIHREVNKGAGAARNAGIAAATGELVAFQDDDDRWLLDKLERQVAALRANPDASWCLCGSIRLEKGRTRYIGGAGFIRDLDYRRGIGPGGPDWGMIATPGWLVRRELINRVGAFDERIRSWDDWELGLRMWQQAKWVIVDEPLWLQDWIVGAGLTRAERTRSNDMRIFLEKHGALWSGDRGVMARHWYVIGRGESLHDGGGAGRSELLRAVSLAPWRLRYWAALALALAPRKLMQSLTSAVRARRERRRTAGRA
jgi:glycosyltransferase involved in cell wall biosynthesis